MHACTVSLHLMDYRTLGLMGYQANGWTD